MAPINLDRWDENRYRELNAYFRIRIKTLLESDPYFKEILAQEQGLQLQDLVNRMTNADQVLWTEFLELDQLKLHIDLQNHLEGKGMPFAPQRGFGNNLFNSEEEATW